MTLVSDGLAIARAGIRAVEPGRAVRRHLHRTPRGFRVGGRLLRVGPGGDLHLVALGKAAAAMIDAAEEVAARRRTRGLAVTPRGYPAPHRSLPILFGEHPIPGRGSFRAGAALLAYVRSLRPEDAVLFLISGGGSAVAEAPAPGISAASVRRTTEILLASGAAIGEMNAIRRHLSALKGGRLADAAHVRSFATLALSDVVGDRPEDIASGPTVPDPTTYADALGVVRRYRLGHRLPAAVVDHLERGARGLLPETSKPPAPSFRGAPFVLAATNRTALGAAALEAQRRGYVSEIRPRPIVGDTRPAGERFAREFLRRAGDSPDRPRALLAGGETTVALAPDSGRGGRNQEFALAAARGLAGSSGWVLSIGTDGVDGPTDAAGGWTDGRTVSRCRERGVDLDRVLDTHSSYGALERLGGLVRTGPTGTNVTDLHVALWAPSTGPWLLPGGLRVVPGPRHWEFPLLRGRLTRAQRRFLDTSGVGLPARGRRASSGWCDWDELLPIEPDTGRGRSRRRDPQSW